MIAAAVTVVTGFADCAAETGAIRPATAGRGYFSHSACLYMGLAICSTLQQQSFTAVCEQRAPHRGKNIFQRTSVHAA
jgi:hypothetical protein